MKYARQPGSAKSAVPFVLLLCAALVFHGAFTPGTRAARTARPAQALPSAVGEWSAPQWLNFIPIHVSVLPTGKVLMWGRDTVFNSLGQERDANDTSRSHIFDPAVNAITNSPIFNNTTNLFCSGHSFLPDGRLFVAGGHDGDDGRGEPHTNIFDPATNQYSAGPPMSLVRGGGRWYPTNCALGNGETLVTSGTNEDGAFNPLPQVLQTNMTWRNLTGASENKPLYPMMLLAPTGNVFMAGPNSLTRYLSTSGAGAWVNGGIETGGGQRDYGTAAMFEDGRILLAGGGTPTNTAQTISLTRDPAVWQSAGSMQFERKQLNSTLLPDGTVLITGGTRIGFSDPNGAVYAAELWNPDTNGWTTLASAARPRLYHSTAVLLPDGRVLTGGGGGLRPPDHSIDEPTLEIYSPPYLFKGPRPTISSAPSVVNHGAQVFVGTPDAASISKVTMVRLSSVTHAFNQNQRINTLSFVREASGLTVRMPASGNLCPPGHYMLFIVNSNGVPSVASMVQVTVPASPTNSIDDQRFFVRQLYYDLFNREPDLGGWNGWSNYVFGCGTDAACLKFRRVETARLMMTTSEFRRDRPAALQNPGTLEYRQEFVRQCYLVYLRRQPDTNGFNNWVNYFTQTNDEWGVVHGFLYAGEYRNRFNKP